MKAARRLGMTLVAVAFATPAAFADDPAHGKDIFEHICHQCHAALPYTGRIGDANLPKFLANPKRYKPTTAMTFPGLKSPKDIADVIAYITAGH
jgi:cytochrome c2